MSKPKTAKTRPAFVVTFTVPGDASKGGVKFFMSKPRASKRAERLTRRGFDVTITKGAVAYTGGKSAIVAKAA